MARFILVLTALVGLSLARPSDARAQATHEGAAHETGDTEMSDAENAALARDQFAQGMRFARRNRWQQAADRFGRALELKETPQIRYNLAESLVHLGRLVEALEQLTLLRESDDVPPTVERSADGLRGIVADRIGRLRIEVRGRRADVRVRLDGTDLPPAVLGVDHPIDPGRHLVRLVVGDGEVVQSEEVLVPDGRTVVVTLVAPSLSPVEAPSSEASRTDAVDDDSSSLWWLWTTLAIVVLAGGGVAAYFIATDEQSPTAGDFMPGFLEIR